MSGGTEVDSGPSSSTTIPGDYCDQCIALKPIAEKFARRQGTAGRHRKAFEWTWRDANALAAFCVENGELKRRCECLSRGSGIAVACLDAACDAIGRFVLTSDQFWQCANSSDETSDLSPADREAWVVFVTHFCTDAFPLVALARKGDVQTPHDVGPYMDGRKMFSGHVAMCMRRVAHAVDWGKLAAALDDVPCGRDAVPQLHAVVSLTHCLRQFFPQHNRGTFNGVMESALVYLRRRFRGSNELTNELINPENMGPDFGGAVRDTQFRATAHLCWQWSVDEIFESTTPRAHNKTGGSDSYMYALEPLGLRLAIDFLSAPLLQARIAAVNQINEYVRQIAEMLPHQDIHQEIAQLQCDLAHELDACHLIDALFNQRAHAEVIKQAPVCVEFMCRHGRLCADGGRPVQAICGTAETNKDCARQCHELLRQLLPLVDADSVATIYAHVCRVPPAEHSDASLQLLYEVLATFWNLSLARQLLIVHEDIGHAHGLRGDESLETSGLADVSGETHSTERADSDDLEHVLRRDNDDTVGDGAAQVEHDDGQHERIGQTTLGDESKGSRKRPGSEECDDGDSTNEPKKLRVCPSDAAAVWASRRARVIKTASLTLGTAGTGNVHPVHQSEKGVDYGRQLLDQVLRIKDGGEWGGKKRGHFVLSGRSLQSLPPTGRALPADPTILRPSSTNPLPTASSPAARSDCDLAGSGSSGRVLATDDQSTSSDPDELIEEDDEEDEDVEEEAQRVHGGKSWHRGAAVAAVDRSAAGSDAKPTTSDKTEDEDDDEEEDDAPSTEGISDEADEMTGSPPHAAQAAVQSVQQRHRPPRGHAPGPAKHNLYVRPHAQQLASYMRSEDEDIDDEDLEDEDDSEDPMEMSGERALEDGRRWRPQRPPSTHAAAFDPAVGMHQKRWIAATQHHVFPKNIAIEQKRPLLVEGKRTASVVDVREVGSAPLAAKRLEHAATDEDSFTDEEVPMELVGGPVGPVGPAFSGRPAAAIASVPSVMTPDDELLARYRSRLGDAQWSSLMADPRRTAHLDMRRVADPGATPLWDMVALISVPSQQAVAAQHQQQPDGELSGVPVPLPDFVKYPVKCQMSCKVAKVMAFYRVRDCPQDGKNAGVGLAGCGEESGRAHQLFVDLMDEIADAKIALAFLAAAVKAIHEDNAKRMCFTTVGVLLKNLADGRLANFPYHRMKPDSVVPKIDAQYKIVDSILTNLNTYIETTQVDPSNRQMCQQYQADILSRLGAIESVFSAQTSSKKYTLSVHQAEQIWHSLYTNGGPVARNLVCTWLCRVLRNPNGLHLLNDAILGAIIAKKVPSMVGAHLSVTELQLALELRVRCRSARSARLCAKVLWRCALNNANADASRRAMHAISEHYAHVGALGGAEAEERSREFVSICLQHVSAAVSKLQSAAQQHQTAARHVAADESERMDDDAAEQPVLDAALMELHRALLILHTHLDDFRKRHGFLVRLRELSDHTKCAHSERVRTGLHLTNYGNPVRVTVAFSNPPLNKLYLDLDASTTTVGELRAHASYKCAAHYLHVVALAAAAKDAALGSAAAAAAAATSPTALLPVRPAQLEQEAARLAAGTPARLIAGVKELAAAINARTLEQVGLVDGQVIMASWQAPAAQLVPVGVNGAPLEAHASPEAGHQPQQQVHSSPSSMDSAPSLSHDVQSASPTAILAQPENLDALMNTVHKLVVLAGSGQRDCDAAETLPSEWRRRAAAAAERAWTVLCALPTSPTRMQTVAQMLSGQPAARPSTPDPMEAGSMTPPPPDPGPSCRAADGTATPSASDLCSLFEWGRVPELIYTAQLLAALVDARRRQLVGEMLDGNGVVVVEDCVKVLHRLAQATISGAAGGPVANWHYEAIGSLVRLLYLSCSRGANANARQSAGGENAAQGGKVPPHSPVGPASLELTFGGVEIPRSASDGIGGIPVFMRTLRDLVAEATTKAHTQLFFGVRGLWRSSLDCVRLCLALLGGLMTSGTTPADALSLTDVFPTEAELDDWLHKVLVQCTVPELRAVCVNFVHRLCTWAPGRSDHVLRPVLVSLLGLLPTVHALPPVQCDELISDKYRTKEAHKAAASLSQPLHPAAASSAGYFTLLNALFECAPMKRLADDERLGGVLRRALDDCADYVTGRPAYERRPTHAVGAEDFRGPESAPSAPSGPMLTLMTAAAASSQQAAAAAGQSTPVDQGMRGLLNTLAALARLRPMWKFDRKCQSFLSQLWHLTFGCDDPPPSTCCRARAATAATAATQSEIGHTDHQWNCAPVIMSMDCRLAALDCMAELCTGCPATFRCVFDRLSLQHDAVDSRGWLAQRRVIAKWLASETEPGVVAEQTTAAASVDVVEQQRSVDAGAYPWEYWPCDERRPPPPCNRLGLTNMGATCYLAAAVQHLFFIPDLVAVVLNTRLQAVRRHQDVFHELSSMFAFLAESERRCYEPRSFLQRYQMDGAQLNPAEQRDMTEFFTDLINKLEEMSPEIKSVVRSLFCGVMSNNVVSDDCPHVSTTTEEFYTVRCLVENVKDLHSSLERVTVADVLDGDNMYTCCACGSKVRAKKRAAFRSLPQVLCFNTMRYSFNMISMQREKVNTYFSFPMELDMGPYMERALLPRPAPSDASQATPGESDDQAPAQDQCTKYELCGVTVHTGTADGGHYYCFVRDPLLRHRWYALNDSDARVWDPVNIPAECFGGEIDRSPLVATMDRFFPDFSFEKSNSAYMVFYQRADKVFKPVNYASLLDEKLRLRVLRDNFRFSRDLMLFDVQYTNFLWSFCASVSKSLYSALAPGSGNEPNSNADTLSADDIAFKTAQLSLKFICETYIHSKEKAVMSNWMEFITKQLSACPAAAEWFLRELTQTEKCTWLRTVLVECCIATCRGLLNHLINFAMNQVGKKEFDKFALPWVPGCCVDDIDLSEVGTHSSCTRVILALHQLLEMPSTIELGLRQLSDLFALMLNFGKTHPSARVFMLLAGTVRRVVACYMRTVYRDLVDSVAVQAESVDGDQDLCAPPASTVNLATFRSRNLGGSLERIQSLLVLLLQEARLNEHGAGLMPHDLASLMATNFTLPTAASSSEATSQAGHQTSDAKTQVVNHTQIFLPFPFIVQQIRDTVCSTPNSGASGIGASANGVGVGVAPGVSDCKGVQGEGSKAPARLLIALAQLQPAMVEKLVEEIFTCITKHCTKEAQAVPLFSVLTQLCNPANYNSASSKLVRSGASSSQKIDEGGVNSDLPQRFVDCCMGHIWPSAESSQRVSAACLHWLSTMAQLHDSVHAKLLAQLDDWLQPFLIKNNVSVTRMAAAGLLLSLTRCDVVCQRYANFKQPNAAAVGGTCSSATSVGAVAAPAAGDTAAAGEVPAQSAEILHLVYTQLLDLLVSTAPRPRHRNGAKMQFGAGAAQHQQHNSHRLVPFFNALRACLVTEEQKLLLIAPTHQYANAIWLHYDAVHFATERLHGVKQALMLFLHAAVDRCAPVIEELLHPDLHIALHERYDMFMKNLVTVDPKDRELCNYNRITLPAYYGCMRLLAHVSAQFARAAMCHTNLDWALEWVVVRGAGCDYAAAPGHILAVVDRCAKLPHAGAGDAMAAFRVKVWKWAVEANRSSRANFNILLSVLTSLCGTASHRRQLLNSGALDALSIALHTAADMLIRLGTPTDLMEVLRWMKIFVDVRQLTNPSGDHGNEDIDVVTSEVLCSWKGQVAREACKRLLCLLNSHVPHEIRSTVLSILSHVVQCAQPDRAADVELLKFLLFHVRKAHTLDLAHNFTVSTGTFFPRRQAGSGAAAANGDPDSSLPTVDSEPAAVVDRAAGAHAVELDAAEWAGAAASGAADDMSVDECAQGQPDQATAKVPQQQTQLPLEAKLSMHLNPMLLEAAMGVDWAYDASLRSYFSPYHNWCFKLISAVCLGDPITAAGDPTSGSGDGVQQVLADGALLATALAVESVCLHSAHFAHFALELWHRREEAAPKALLSHIRQCENFTHYLLLVVTDEVANLAVQTVFDFAKIFVHNVGVLSKEQQRRVVDACRWPLAEFALHFADGHFPPDKQWSYKALTLHNKALGAGRAMQLLLSPGSPPDCKAGGDGAKPTSDESDAGQAPLVQFDAAELSEVHTQTNALVHMIGDAAGNTAAATAAGDAAAVDVHQSIARLRVARGCFEELTATLARLRDA